MISLDITSLFTNVPLIKTLNYIGEQVGKLSINIDIHTEILNELTLRCTMNVTFKFDDTFYRQVDRVTMGSPLGPILADFFLSKLQNRPLYNLISKLSFYCRYMDYTFILCDNGSDKSTIITEFNEVHSAMKFTCEEESQDRIAFLDVLLTRKPDGSIKRNLHRKSTWTEQYTHIFIASFLSGIKEI
uniref:Reverse transcriptase domain-containing protein n=1 Tax=Trichobilharzia regenti TaxID=157069 RepID=A0AA85J1B9_TRIRE|nr:unnamed protein product [Trichobilharzia regenti]